ncbi:PREDICTED: protein FAM76A [Rhagoletis zephyria]|uniref:protein FAM76A n=1 Tax=Rhagoletis zephyria TaxID=28612 RepID=UPI0008115A34|nr:PREDICTED: protein FAM76A [Rhagoletis zephyria]
MSSVLFACSKCFSRHPFEELSAGQQLCKNCRGSSSIVKCTYCRTEFQPTTKSQSACKKCEHCLNKYGKPNACECCKIVAAFGSSKCIRCATYEAKYGPPIQCDECKQRCAFDKRDENKKINGKLLCWLCTNSFKRALLKAQQDGRISAKKRPHEKIHRDSSTNSAKKSSRPSADVKGSSGGAGGGSSAAIASSGGDLPDKVSRTGSGGSGGNGSGNGSGIGLGSIAAPAVITIDPNSADHVVAMTNLKERIASLEKRLQQKDKELLEKDKLLTELKGKNFEKEIEMRNKLKEVDRLHEMKVENLNRKVSSLLKELASVKKSTKKNGTSGGSNAKERQSEREKRENLSPKDELVEEEQQREKEIKEEKTEKEDSKSDDEQDQEEKGSVGSGSNSPSTN